MKRTVIVFLCLINFIFADLANDFNVAIRNNDYSKVEALLKKGAKVNSTEIDWEMKPLFLAVDSSGVNFLNEDEINSYIDTKIKIIELLISKGANINDFSHDGGRYSEYIKLFDTITNSKISVLLAKKGVKFDSLLEAATAKNEKEKTEELLKKSSKETKELALKIAVKFGYKEIVNLFLLDGEISKSNALFSSVYYNQYEVTKILLQAKANPNIEAYYKEMDTRIRPIDIALIHDNKAIFDLLLQYGADISQWSGTLKNGQGIETYENGDTYEGEFKDSLPNGKGTYTSSRYTYIGQWKDGLRNGKGIETYENGDKYEGEYNNDLRNGKGTYTSSNGDVYIGQWKDDLQVGKGVINYANGSKYTGDFVEDLKSGQGIETYEDGGKYEGDFKDDLWNGKGTYTSSNGDVYIGQWKDGKLVSDN